MAASLLTSDPLVLTNMPRLADTRVMGGLLKRLGADLVERDGPAGAETVLHVPEITSALAPYDLVRKMRATFNVLGPLLAREGHAKVSLPGGCAIGARPVDLHLKMLGALGAHIDLHEGYVYAQAPRGLTGAPPNDYLLNKLNQSASTGTYSESTGRGPTRAWLASPPAPGASCRSQASSSPATTIRTAR